MFRRFRIPSKKLSKLLIGVGVFSSAIGIQSRIVNDNNIEELTDRTSEFYENLTEEQVSEKIIYLKSKSNEYGLILASGVFLLNAGVYLYSRSKH